MDEAHGTNLLLADGGGNEAELLLSKFAQLMKAADARVNWGED